MENSTFQQLMISEQSSELTVEQRDFVETHKQIISCGRMAARYFVELARKLKQMRDGKLYLAAGFQDFESYVEEAVGLKKRHAYNYIRVAETYTDQYLEEHASAGVTKLTLLAQVNDSVRAEIEDNIDINTASTAEVKEAVQAAIRERDEAQKQLSLMDGRLTEKDEELKESEAARMSVQKAYDEKSAELRKAKEREKELQEKEKKLTEELKAAQKAVKTVPDKESKKEAEAQRKRADALEKQLRETSAQLAEATAQKKVIANDSIIVFKAKFNDLQRVGEDIDSILRTMDEESAFKCKSALGAVLKKWQEAWA